MDESSGAAVAGVIGLIAIILVLLFAIFGSSGSQSNECEEIGHQVFCAKGLRQPVSSWEVSEAP